MLPESQGNSFAMIVIDTTFDFSESMLKTQCSNPNFNFDFVVFLTADDFTGGNRL